MTTHRPKEKRIATSGFALLAMTEVDESQSRRFPLRRMSKTARRLTKAVIPRPVLKLVVGIRIPSPSPPLLRAHLARLCAEADALHRADPGFDLDSALRDPAFVRLTAPDVGVPVADAWYALHRREYAETLRRESLEQAAAAVASGSMRPREGGRTSGGELLGTDPRHMTAAQRAELRDRIKRGERVYPR